MRALRYLFSVLWFSRLFRNTPVPPKSPGRQKIRIKTIGDQVFKTTVDKVLKQSGDQVLRQMQIRF